MPRLLVIEDEPDLRELIQGEFELAGFEVLQAPNGAAGVALVRSALPDIVLMDVDFGGLRPNGLEATAELKSDQSTCHIPIIMLTGRVMPAERKAARDAGCDDLVEKSASNFDALLECVQSLLQARQLT